MSADVFYMGYDHGNGFNKIKAEGNLSFVLPSYLAREGAYRFENMDASNVNLAIFRYLNEEMPQGYIWGEDMHRLKESEFLPTFGEEDRYHAPGYLRASLFGIAKALPKRRKPPTVKMVIGVPSREKGKPGKPSQTEIFLKDLFENKGEIHRVEIREHIEGKETIVVKEFTVEIVAILSQPIGSIYNVMLRDDGRTLDKSWLDSTMVLDIGMGTFCADAIKNGDIAIRHSDLKGIGRALQIIADKIKPELKATKEGVEIALRSGAKYYGPSSHKADHHFQEYADQALRDLAEEILNDLRSRGISILDFEKLLVVGGGAHLIGKYIEEQFPHAVIPAEPQHSNVNGYFKRLRNLQLNGKA